MGLGTDRAGSRKLLTLKKKLDNCRSYEIPNSKRQIASFQMLGPWVSGVRFQQEDELQEEPDT